MTVTEPLPGYNTQAVEAWIGRHVASLHPPLKWTRFEGGHSNLTYRLDDSDGHAAVIRRPPLGELLPKAHDMAREWAVISALGPTRVPVAAALGFCEDPGVTGAKFYVMGYVAGHSLHNSADTQQWVPEQPRTRLAHSFIDVLAELHALDPDDIGLGDLGKKNDYIARQLKTWYRSWTASIGPAQYDDPRAHRLQEFYLANIPDQGPARIVHGDYGIHNCLFGPDCMVAAVVDWEIATLGDPLADLAYALNQWPDPTDPEPPLPEGATALPGFPSRTELAARYAARTGRDLSGLDYYAGFCRWKSAAIVHGVYARYMEGKKSTVGVDLAGLRQSIDRSLELSDRVASRLQRQGPPPNRTVRKIV
ncbi:MAG TPA: phosphotransferase family protein [Candidatus Binataceae bacterium]|nr:phosphotransferase family protein [Candidatus Binataceae bacterium]